MKGFFQAPWRFAACYAAFLIAAFTWALLDTFPGFSRTKATTRCTWR